MPNASTPLSLRRVSKRFGEAGSTFNALAQVDLELGAGQVVALVGPSGCGKSTLLRIVAGLELASEGQVFLGERVVRGADPACGVVFQEHRLLPWLTAAQNVEFGLRSLPRAERRALASAELARVGLSGFEQAYPHQLSGGMAQRVALARALAPNPSLLLLDEPFAALDAFTKARMQQQLLLARGRSHPTTLLVTHDVEEAVFLADRVVVMSERPGTICADIAIELARPRDRTSDAVAHWRRRVLQEFSTERSPEPARLVQVASQPDPCFALCPTEEP
ncbi:MAG: ABC transporter ATP-binding protein [Polyangiaceae bacterium]